jgi:hypothetical protein
MDIAALKAAAEKAIVGGTAEHDPEVAAWREVTTLEKLHREANPTSILSMIARYQQMEEALSELADLVEAMLEGEYTPDSFTTQPARMALRALEPVQS